MNAMKPIRLFHLYQHIQQKVTCPHCKHKLFPEDIKITTSTEDSVFLSLHCPHCQRDAEAHVLINAIGTPSAVEQSSEVELSPGELEEAHDFLLQYEGGVSGLFQKTT